MKSSGLSAHSSRMKPSSAQLIGAEREVLLYGGEVALLLVGESLLLVPALLLEAKPSRRSTTRHRVLDADDGENLTRLRSHVECMRTVNGCLSQGSSQLVALAEFAADAALERDEIQRLAQLVPIFWEAAIVGVEQLDAIVDHQRKTVASSSSASTPPSVLALARLALPLV